MAKKIKISEAAKDLKLSAKELVAFLEEKTEGKKTTSSSMTEEEYNLVLEHYSQERAVDSFDAYFAMRNEPRTACEEQPAEKAPKIIVHIYHFAEKGQELQSLALQK